MQESVLLMPRPKTIRNVNKLQSQAATNGPRRFYACG